MQQGEKYRKLKLKPYEYAEIAYRYATVYKESDKALNDYGTGEQYTALEAHMVTRIEDNPGITVTEIANQTNRTKGAVSQVITKLEGKDLVRREKDPENPRRVCLYVTPKGLELSQCHKRYDDTYMGEKLDRLISLYGYDAVEKYYQIMLDNVEQWNSKE